MINSHVDRKVITLGATMYMPALHPDLLAIGNGLKLKNLRSVVFCTEDSVADRDLHLALKNITKTLQCLESAEINRFVRPRNPEVLRAILDMSGVEKLDGFVLPKASFSTLPSYFNILEPYKNFEIMPTLETNEVFDLIKLYQLRDYLETTPLNDQIIALRIGALDLLSQLGLRRDSRGTIYETPLGHVIDQLITVFKPSGFALTAPGFECFDNEDIFMKELTADVARGLFGKTALHPKQIDLIHQFYSISADDLEVAQAIKNPDKPAVFSLKNRMCEKTVHDNWATSVLLRAEIYGIDNYDLSKKWGEQCKSSEDKN